MTAAPEGAAGDAAVATRSALIAVVKADRKVEAVSVVTAAAVEAVAVIAPRKRLATKPVCPLVKSARHARTAASDPSGMRPEPRARVKAAKPAAVAHAAEEVIVPSARPASPRSRKARPMRLRSRMRSSTRSPESCLRASNPRRVERSAREAAAAAAAVEADVIAMNHVHLQPRETRLPRRAQNCSPALTKAPS